MNEFIIKNGYFSQGNSTITGSLIVTAGITGSISGSVTGLATSASFASTASFIATAQTASYVLNAVSSSFATSASRAVSASFASTASYINPLNQDVVITGSLTVSSSFGVLIDDYAYDSLIVPSLNWGTRNLFDQNGNQSIDWGSKIAYDYAVVPSVDWANRGLYDSTNAASIGWEGKTLYAAGIAIMQWDSPSLSETVVFYKYQSTVLNPENLETFIATNSNIIGSAPMAVSGEIIGVSSMDSNVALGNIVHLASDGTWYQADASYAVSSSGMLGVALGIGARPRVLLEGTIAVNDAGATDVTYCQNAQYGVPVYLRDSTPGELSTNPPGSGTTRIVGHIYYNSTNDSTYWLMKFKPSNDWYVI